MNWVILVCLVICLVACLLCLRTLLRLEKEIEARISALERKEAIEPSAATWKDPGFKNYGF